jgi:hypothetical protein
MVSRLPCVKNDKDQVVTWTEPWKFKAKVPDELKGNKPAYLKWRRDADHMLFCAASGVNADVRPSKDTNPVRQLYAIVADYDFPITREIEKTIYEKKRLMPNWISKTFSGGRRLVWLFEDQIPFDTEIAPQFYRIVEEKLDVKGILPGLDDEQSWGKPAQIFDVGYDWEQLNTKPIPTNTLQYWLMQAGTRTKFTTSDTKIPLADVKAEIDRLFPGKWTGDFAQDARGPVFWEGRENASAAVVTDNGMIAFSSHKLFHSWRDILGAAFVDKYTQDKVGSLVGNVWYDGSSFYRTINDVWHPESKDDFRQWLMWNHLSAKRYDDELSEVDKAEIFVKNQRRIDGAAPRLFDSRTIVEEDGARRLNISRARLMQPADVSGDWGTHFPFIARMWDKQFGDKQLPFWTAWTKRFYLSAYRGRLQTGHVVFLVGGVDAGKTLIGQRILGPLFGGAGDASDYVAGNSEFNKHLVEKAVWTIDDGKLATNPNTRQKFGEMVKRLVANSHMVYRAMWHDNTMTRWNGRLLVSLNNDPISIQMIPDLGQSMEEKIMAFEIAQGCDVWPQDYEMEPIIYAELPHLARWLIEAKVDESVLGTNRLGVKHFIHSEVRSNALYSTGVGDAIAIVDVWNKCSAHTGTPWRGTAHMWYVEAIKLEEVRSLLSKMNPRALGKRFAEAAEIPDSGIRVVSTDSKRGHIYEIQRPINDEL